MKAQFKEQKKRIDESAKINVCIRAYVICVCMFLNASNMYLQYVNRQ